MRQSSFQNAHLAVLRNQLWINVARFRAWAAGDPDPTSERSLPVPYGCEIGHTLASLDLRRIRTRNTQHAHQCKTGENTVFQKC